ncbi:hypothetical protein HDU67_007964 [Dinochytrium kinnereticum]|nr:hypothetical protein HDU67_007964 [Dinochytrium kinnereticum]
MDYMKKPDIHHLIQCYETIEQSAQEFQSDQLLRQSTEHEWLRYGKEMTQALEEIAEDMAFLNEQADMLREEDREVWAASLEEIVGRHEDELKESKRVWGATIDWVSENAGSFEDIKQILTNHAHPTLIDVSKFHLNVPEELVRSVDLRNGNFGMYTSDGDLDFSNVFKLGHVLAKLLSVEVNKASSIDLTPLGESISGEVEGSRRKLQEALESEERLVKDLEAVRESIEGLRLSRILPAKPSIPKTPRFKSAPDSQNNRPFDTAKKSRYQKSTLKATPAAISEISNAVRNKHHQQLKPVEFRMTLSLGEVRATPARKPAPRAIERVQGSALRRTSVAERKGTPVANSAGRSKMKTGIKKIAPAAESTTGGRKDAVKVSVKAVASQIVDSIYATGSDAFVDKTPRTAKGAKVRFEKLHAATNPLAALGTEGFQPRAEIMRTPLRAPPPSSRGAQSRGRTPLKPEFSTLSKKKAGGKVSPVRHHEMDGSSIDLGLDEKSVFYDGVFDRDGLVDEDLFGENEPNFLLQDGPDDAQFNETNNDGLWDPPNANQESRSLELLDSFPDWTGDGTSLVGPNEVQESLDLRDIPPLPMNPSLSFESVRGPDFWEHQDSAIVKSEVIDVPTGHPDPSSILDVQGGSLIDFTESPPPAGSNPTELLVPTGEAAEGSVFLDGFRAWNEAHPNLEDGVDVQSGLIDFTASSNPPESIIDEVTDLNVELERETRQRSGEGEGGGGGGIFLDGFRAWNDAHINPAQSLGGDGGLIDFRRSPPLNCGTPDLTDGQGRGQSGRSGDGSIFLDGFRAWNEAQSLI